MSQMPSWENGSVIKLHHNDFPQINMPLLVESYNSSVSFCLLERPYLRLKVKQGSGKVFWSAASGKWSSFQPIIQEESQQYCFCLDANTRTVNKDGTIGWYLSISDDIVFGHFLELPFIGNCGITEKCFFRVVEIARKASMRLVSEIEDVTWRSCISESQKREFMDQGFIRLRDIVPISFVNAALRRINNELGKPGATIEGGVEGGVKLAGSVANSIEILDLYFCTKLRYIAESFIGVESVEPPRGAQIALRFPELGEVKEPLGREWHTDGMRKGKLNPFTLLIGVVLSDVPSTLSGNFTVFPKSHYLMHKLLLPEGKLKNSNVECSGHKKAWGDGTLPDLSTPLQLTASRGDIILAHPKLAHRGGPNYSPDIRYQVYFRLKHKKHAELLGKLVDDLWGDFDGLNSLESL